MRLQLGKFLILHNCIKIHSVWPGQLRLKILFFARPGREILNTCQEVEKCEDTFKKRSQTHLKTREKYWILEQVQKNKELNLKHYTLNSLFFAKFGKSISSDTICGVIRENNPTKNLKFHGPVEKYWILEHAEQYKEMTKDRLAQIFRAEFGRSISQSTIFLILKKRAEIIEIFASWAQGNVVKIKPQKFDCSRDCKTEVDEVDLKSPIDKCRDRQWDGMKPASRPGM